MTLDLELRIDHADGGTSVLGIPTPERIDVEPVALTRISLRQSRRLVDRGEATVVAIEWRDVVPKINRRDDTVEIVRTDTATDETIIGGRLDDWQFSGATASVQVDSFERDALDTKPVDSFSESGADDAIATSIINLMPDTITAGTIDTVDADTELSAKQTPPGSLLRELAATTGATVRYRPDGTVDYLDRRGTDRSVEVSPTAQTLIGDPRVRETIREDATNVRVISQQDATVFADATVTSDPGREVWLSDQLDSTSQSRLQSRADALASEISDAPSYLEVEATLDLELLDAPEPGDTYATMIPQHDVDERLAVADVDRRIDGAGDTAQVTLSNRRLTLRGDA